MSLKLILTVMLTVVGTATLQQFVRLARVPFRLAFWAALILLTVTLAGCAVLPIPFQPQNEQYNSNMAEGAWLVLDGVDTLQTMHLKPNTSCAREADPIAVRFYGSEYPSKNRVLLTNLALATVHTMVTSWLDDKVAQHANDDSAGPWYVGRIAWHTVSIAYSFASVMNNVKQKCPL
jgi:hypothetical protein